MMKIKKLGAVSAAIIVLLAACAASYKCHHDPQPAYQEVKSPAGVRVLVPEPLWGHKDLSFTLQEVDIANPPKGWTIRIRSPLFFVNYALESKPTWVRGATYHSSKRIDVGWKCPGEPKFLPALEWEVSLSKLSYEEAVKKDLEARKIPN